ncbi:UNKNOWN [Stylonychia lemnae]|uniref:Uncharacterized protein n=1 Tax=Stylonychia lemnae TaxID=5949 RepID=A0A078A1V3_STYLE|nr:UNKNOWN [Stylonychia lemnae]|eukprot:CDW75443.1 UNKNOWN [Stylonychia lemnae]
MSDQVNQNSLNKSSIVDPFTPQLQDKTRSVLNPKQNEVNSSKADYSTDEKSNSFKSDTKNIRSRENSLRGFVSNGLTIMAAKKQRKEERCTTSGKQNSPLKIQRKNTRNIIRQRKEDSEHEKQKIREALYLSKKEEVQQLKRLEAQNRQRKNFIIHELEAQGKDRFKMIKSQEIQAQQKLLMIKEYKAKEAQKEIQKRIEQENDYIKKKEKEVIQMELLEIELIKKLQNSQTVQKIAYQELEQALHNGTKELKAQGSSNN